MYAASHWSGVFIMSRIDVALVMAVAAAEVAVNKAGARAPAEAVTRAASLGRAAPPRLFRYFPSGGAQRRRIFSIQLKK